MFRCLTRQLPSATYAKVYLIPRIAETISTGITLETFPKEQYKFVQLSKNASNNLRYRIKCTLHLFLFHKVFDSTECSLANVDGPKKGFGNWKLQCFTVNSCRHTQGLLSAIIFLLEEGLFVLELKRKLSQGSGEELVYQLSNLLSYSKYFKKDSLHKLGTLHCT